MRVTEYRIPGCPARIAQLSDLHGKPYEGIVARVAACAPELIAVTGDVLFRHKFRYDRSPLDTQRNVLPFLTACAALAPTFLSLGNHEWMLDGDDLRRLRETGVTLLDNEYRTVRIAGQAFVIGGLTSAAITAYRRQKETARTITAEQTAGSPPGAQEKAERYPKRNGPHGLRGIWTSARLVPDTAWLEAFAAEPGYHVLLSHHPEDYPLIPDGVELILSGHAHGGQWAYYSFRKRRMCGVLSPGQGFFPKWTKGVYDGRLVVSAGLSNTVAPIPRLCNPRQIVVVRDV